MEVPAAEITIKDIDSAIVRYYDKILDIHVAMPQTGGDDKYKVPVIFAGKERWKMSRDGAATDLEGKIILPAIIVRRDGIDRTPGVNALGTEQPYIFVSKRVDPKTNIVQKNYYDRRTADVHPHDRTYRGAVYETVTMPYPETLTVRYRIIVWSSYITQVNEILETMWHSLDYALNFKFPVKNLGDEVDVETKEPSKVYMIGRVQPDLAHEFNTDDFSREERMIRCSFEVLVYASTYMYPKSTGMSYGKDSKGKKIVERQYSAYKIVWNKEKDWFSGDED